MSRGRLPRRSGTARRDRACDALRLARHLDSLFGEAAKLKLPWRYDLTRSGEEIFHSVVVGPSTCPEPGCTTDHANPVAWDIGEESAKLIVQAVNHLFAQYEAEKE